MMNELTLGQVMAIEDELNEILDRRSELENEENPNESLINDCTSRYSEAKKFCRMFGYNVEREIKKNGKAFLVKIC